LSEKRLKVVRIAGFVLIAAALCVIGYSAYNLISTDINTQNSLLAAEQLLEAGQLIDEMDAYTGNPDASLPPDAAIGIDNPQAGGGSAGSADAGQGDGADTDGISISGLPAPSGAAGTSNPGKSGGGIEAKPIVLGMLVFNSLGGRKVPVLEGVTDRDLGSGAAHHPRSSPPGGVGNCVIFGHRNTVFRGFGKLKVGDTILFKVPGTTYKYAIKSMTVVDPDDPRIFQAYGSAAMTLVTCYPFNYVGPAPQRYIVVAVLQ
jgi:LPXTG-site transpeptidase (sortase) family protein